MLGVTLGNFSGTPGLLINPAMITNNKSFLDINLISADVFVHNNFVYIPISDYKLSDISKSGYTLPSYGEDSNSFLYYENHNLKNATVNVRVLGPSAMVQVGKHGLALQTGVRFFTSGSQLPWEVPVFAYEGLVFPDLHNIRFIDNEFDFSSTAWMEVGLTYGYDVYEFLDEKITVAITVKKLWGYSGISVKSQNVDYVVYNDSTMSIVNMNAEIGFALPMDYNQSGFEQVGPTFKGSGVGLDIGVVYVKKKQVTSNQWRGGKLCSQTYDDYIYRLGVSILDIGRIKYKNNAEIHTYTDVSAYWEHVDTLDYYSMNQFMTSISEALYGDPEASYSGNSLKIGLPTALSVQFDYHLKKKFFVSAFFIHPLRFNDHTLRRPAQFAIVPRFETQFFEISLPISVYEYQYPRIGLAARLFMFTIGTERLGTYLGMGDFNGLDIYASIRFSIGKGSCRSPFGGACSNANFGNKNLGR